MKRLNFQANLAVTFLREGKQFVAYSPALDLSTAGRSLEQAKKRFTEAAMIFFEECHKMGTLKEVLLDLGWRGKKDVLTPPAIVAQDYQRVAMPLTV